MGGDAKCNKTDKGKHAFWNNYVDWDTIIVQAYL